MEKDTPQVPTPPGSGIIEETNTDAESTGTEK